MSPITIRSAYSPHVVVSIDCDPTEGKTKQSFKDECDINQIMDNWLKTGEPPHAPPTIGVYGDFSNTTDYQSALDQVLNAGRAFSRLPLKIRARFGNQAKQLLAFLDDPNNEAEAVELGIIADPNPPPPPSTDPPGPNPPVPAPVPDPAPDPV